MARFFPTSPRAAEPDSERKVREALAALDDEWRVFPSVAWQAVRGGRQGDGEADFVLLHPRDGILVMEVKGGGVRVEGGRWSTVDRHGATFPIKDPFRQAVDSKHALLHFLGQLEPRLPSVPRIAHAVVFPDVTVVGSLGTQPREVVIDDADLLSADQAVARVVDHWGQRDSSDLFGPRLEQVAAVLAPTTCLRRRLKADVASAEGALIELTKRQVATLRGLRSVRRCVIRGGAGTGKTLLAVEKARQMARDGGRVLLTCFNAPLGESLAKACADAPNIQVSTFHALCLSRARAAGLQIPRELPSEWWEADAPSLLARSAEVVPADFDALVIDEMQDFSESWLTALMLLLRDPDASPVYCFLDSHQQLYQRSFRIPDWPLFELDTNCRNTLPIARRVATVYSDPKPTEGAVGRNPSFMELTRATDAPSLVQEVVDRLLCDEGLLPAQVTVLADERAVVEALYDLVVPNSCFVPMGGAGVVVETVHRFKGLESEVVVLVTGSSDAASHDPLLYVGMSRARSMLVVLGPKGIRNRFDLQ